MRYKGVKNENFRDEWVKTKLIEFSKEGFSILDVGAGLQPYRELCQELGMNYISHDFGAYIPLEEDLNLDWIGLQNQTWDYPDANIVCDILDIPDSKKYNIILCTEVFEHIPDPVRTLEHLANILRPEGILILTVPFMSLMHQAPFWFQSGLSPFWFKYWTKMNNLEVVELSTSGDYIDFMSQELSRFAAELIMPRFLPRIAYAIPQFFRKKTRIGLLQSGGFGTFLVAKRIQSSQNGN